MSPNKDEIVQAYFWDSRYVKTNGEEPTHEWFGASSVQKLFQRNLFDNPGTRPEDNPLILHLGSGDSVVPVHLAEKGYRRQLCTDFSTVVVKAMTERHHQYAGIEWRVLDVRDMVGIADKSVDVAFEKSMLDVMIYGSPWNPPDEVKENARRYMNEVHRVLADSGVFFVVTFRQPHFFQPLLNQDDLWEIDMQTISEKGCFDTFGYVLRKKGWRPI
ncbi:hypothetical protein CONLIGDRAFT_578215 [Coniochaeta ligniaria NRRL 30616]|uniref:Methyltransferase type 11 domain-containing protein n=1 Tax=Coniochaeta ligniaria NRRL 30616 TaxID=1408157 RepID=A0A1J7IPA4_9PEZI|nr:hypothetical protein CONLIGDRAFT_578215 [Coniochaeta ligniaria NRRL 30616]